MATKATYVDGYIIDDTEVYGLYAGTATITVYLPPITDTGAAANDVVAGWEHVADNTSTGTVELRDSTGRRVVILGPYTKLALRAKNTNQDWAVSPCALETQLTASQLAAAGTGTPTFTATDAPTGATNPTKWEVKLIDGVEYVSPLWVKA